MTMRQSVAVRGEALLLIVLSICEEIPVGDRQNIMKAIMANMGARACEKAFLTAQVYVRFSSSTFWRRVSHRVRVGHRTLGLRRRRGARRL